MWVEAIMMCGVEEEEDDNDDDDDSPLDWVLSGYNFYNLIIQSN